MNRAHQSIAFILIVVAAVVGTTRADAQDMQREVASVEQELPNVLADPAQLSALRSLVATQIDYRIAINLLGYEQSKEFEAIWDNFNSVMYNDGPAGIRAKLQSGVTVDQNFSSAVESAYEANASIYDEFLNRLLRDTFGTLEGTDEIKRRMLRAMIAYAIMNWVQRPDLQSDWHSKSWTFPTCRAAN